jgi:hypoxanthine-DNA glycosylase
MNETEIEEHPFKFFAPENATILIIGSFPGKEQTLNPSVNWFYTTKRNQFWSIIEAVYNKELDTIEKKKQLFKDAGIAVTDIFLKVYRRNKSNLDNNLKIIEDNKSIIETLLQERNFKDILFTSKFVEHHFKKLFPQITNINCLPSPSPRYTRLSKSDKIKSYKEKLPLL